MQKIAILYQAKLPPAKDGIQKPLKPGGYSDSGADIACALYENGLPVVSSVSNPATETDLDWVFPDSKEGIQSAFEKGARIFWLNTVLFDGHPIEILFAEAIEIVGQLPKTVDTYDDKWVTNKLLRENGLSIPDSLLISKDDRTDYQSDFFYPGVVKPVRGRGSQGVYLVKTRQELEIKLSHLFDGNEYGTMVYFEQFLPGQEITVTVMPPGVYRFKDRIKRLDSYWSLPALKRFNHINDVAPYNGTEAVINNSIVLDDYELNSHKIKEVYVQCEKAASLIQAMAPIRIDCRADDKGKYFLFDLNMKPNMTGASRPHRQDQDSLCSLASRKIGWTYSDLLMNMLEQKWKPSQSN